MRLEHRDTFNELRREWPVMISALTGAALTFGSLISTLDDLGWQLAAALSLNMALIGMTVALYRIVTRGKRQHSKELLALRAEIASVQGDAEWDEHALLVAYGEGRLPDSRAKQRKRPPTLTFWLYAREPLRQPNRLRLWFTVEPKWWRVNLYAENGENAVTVGHDRGSVEVSGECMEIEYTAPPLSTSPPSEDGGAVGQLLIWVRADEPIDVARTAAYR